MTSSPAPPSWSGGSQRDAIAELAYNNLMLQPEAPLVPLSPMADNPCARVADRRLLFAFLFAHEVDVLEIALQQHLGYADVMLAESVQTHNVVNRELKPLLWQRLKSTPRFAPYDVTHIVCPPIELSWLSGWVPAWIKDYRWQVCGTACSPCSPCSRCRGTVAAPGSGIDLT